MAAGLVPDNGPHPGAHDPAGVYRPTSVVTSDRAALEALISVHAPAVPGGLLVDASYNTGKIWRRCRYQPDIKLDMDERYARGGCQPGDWNNLAAALPAGGTGLPTVVVWDPPHIMEAGNGVVGGAAWAAEYGTHSPMARRGPDITNVYDQFLLSAAAVLAPRGIVVAKLSDQVHRNRQRWQLFEFMVAAYRCNFTPCDLMIKVRKAAMVDPKWKSVRHVRKVHSYWVVLKLGAQC